MLGTKPLEVVTNYKYLGIEITSSLDFTMQWDRVYSLVSPTIALLKQLKRCGLSEQILVNVFKSLALSHFRYSSTALISCTEKSKSEMQVMHNRMLRIITGTGSEAARQKHGIAPISSFITNTCIEQVSRILNTPNHSLPMSLASNRVTHSDFPFNIPTAKSQKFHNSAVMITLRHMCASYGTHRTAAIAEAKQHTRTRAPSPQPRPSAAKKKCPTCDIEFKRLDLHKCKAAPKASSS
jgi:hypothetical protein